MLLGYEPELPEPRSAKPPENGRLLQPEQHSAILLRRMCCWRLLEATEPFAVNRALTHTVRSLPFFTGPLRSPLRIQNTFANECFMDELCAHTKGRPCGFPATAFAELTSHQRPQGCCECRERLASHVSRQCGTPLARKQ